MVDNNHTTEDISAVPHGPYPAVKPRSALRQTILSLSILVFGILIGSGSTYLYLDRQGRLLPPGINFENPNFERFAMSVVHDMKGEYDLTEEQSGKLRDTFISHFKEMHEMMRQHNEALKPAREKFLSDIKKILTDTQFAQFKKKFEEKVRRWGRGPGGPGQGRGRGDQRRGPGDGEGRRGDGQRGPGSGFGPGSAPRDGSGFGPGGPGPRPEGGMMSPPPDPNIEKPDEDQPGGSEDPAAKDMPI